MAWPTQLDYQEALTFPQHCFRDPELAGALLAAPGLFGLPQPITGNFTNVYHLKSDPEATQQWAVRLFLRDDPARAERYGLLAAHPDKPACFLPFDFQPEGIVLARGAFPLLKMPWIVGEPLNTWIERNLNTVGALAGLAERWAALVQSLVVAQLAHGDLQHGNIFVTPDGQLRLLDYDGMWAPTLAALTPGEVGHPSYQHPRRLYTGLMDRFPALVIYVALRVLSLAPELWYRLDNGDNLLFRREDFLAPQTSRTFALLREVRGLGPLVTALQDACSLPPERTPPLTRYTA